MFADADVIAVSTCRAT